MKPPAVKNSSPPQSPTGSAATRGSSRPKPDLDAEYEAELAIHKERMAVLARQEQAAADRLAEIELTLAQAGNGRGAEILILDEEISAKKRALQYMENERKARQQAMVADEQAAASRLAALKAEIARLQKK